MQPDGSPAPAFLSGGGACGAALRAMGWDTTDRDTTDRDTTGRDTTGRDVMGRDATGRDATGLGPPAGWPPALRTAVSLSLHAAVPIAVFWGPELRFIFGDAWLPLLNGRVDGAMAQPGALVWPDIWDALGPQLRAVMNGGAVSATEAPMPVRRPDGGGSAPETWWTYSLSPVMDGDGRRGGVLATVADVTEDVLTRRNGDAMIVLAERFARLGDADEIVRVGCEAMGHTLRAARVGRGIVDAAAGTVRVSGSSADGLPAADGVYDIDEFWDDWAADDKPVPASVADVETDPRTAARAGRFLALGVRSFMTVPAVEGGEVRLLTFVQSAHVRQWRASDLAFVRDVVGRGRAAADRARAERALNESDVRNRFSVALSPLFMWTARPGGELDHVDGRLLARTGMPDLAARWQEALHPDDREPSARAWAAAVRHGARYDVEHRVRVAEPSGEAGGFRWMRSRASPHLDAAGRVVKWYGSTEDVDDSRRSAAALAASESRLRAVTDSVDQMIWSALPDGTTDYYNQTWYTFTGLPQGSTDMDGWRAVVHPDDRARAWDAWTHAVRTGEPYRIEYRLRHHAGAFRWAMGRAHPVRDAAGRIERWYGTCTDIQEIVGAREVLARSRAELERLVAETAADRERMWRLSTELMAILRADGTLAALNPAWQRVLGWEEAELLGQRLLDLLHPADRDASAAFLRRLGEGRGVSPWENRVAGKDGVFRTLSWTAVPEAGLIHAIGRDNTAERTAAARLEAAQDALRQAQKMEAVGQLTGGIAHDFNNMLAVVIGSLDLLGRRLDPADDRAARYVANAMEGARRAANLTHRLLAFSRQQRLTPVRLDLPALLDGMAGWLRSSLGATLDLELAHGNGIWAALADGNQLENAVLNLAVNARDAMPDGGTLRIETANVTVDEAAGGGAAGSVPPGEWVRLTVTDTGDGIPPELIGRVFDPFFTTKEVGKGTGLGLSQVYGFVAQSGGHVGIASVPGTGTAVTIHLPRAGAAAAGDAPGPAPPAAAAAAEAPAWGAVLVVEDEPAVRRLTADAVGELGYRVLEADGAAAALAVLDGPEEVRLLLTDIVMPDTSGRVLADEAVRRRPGLRVLFSSGFVPGADGMEGGAPLLPKPFTVAQLGGAIRAALG